MKVLLIIFNLLVFDLMGQVNDQIIYLAKKDLILYNVSKATHQVIFKYTKTTKIISIITEKNQIQIVTINDLGEKIIYYFDRKFKFIKKTHLHKIKNENKQKKWLSPQNSGNIYTQFGNLYLINSSGNSTFLLSGGGSGKMGGGLYNPTLSNDFKNVVFEQKKIPLEVFF